ncbi:MAG: TIGR02217 family protein [Novosphingobium sp.]|nr:TIGR02217 family protein [Novosphingobium sp.]
MSHWLATRRTVQQTDTIQRFDPRFWTVNFPRPAMASVITTAPDALRVDAVFQKADDLVGLIWESEDKWDHPLLSYETRRDYSRLTLSFRWRSAGVLPLDAVSGPTLTIEGRDAAGNARAWYVRLWNYATGTPTDAQVRLPFSALDGGFLLPGEADPVHPADIDRLFISLVPPGYGSGAAAFASAASGWAELTEVRCEGHEPMLEIGDVMVPPHGLSICTGYDDAYNLTPARLLRQVRGLGYRASINHYIGMSHFFPLAPDGAGGFVVDPGLPAMNAAALAWHAAFLAGAKAMGATVIASQSYELLAQHCPAAWQQRTFDGEAGLTGWSPPSALLSPANAQAMTWVRKVGVALVGLMQGAGLPVRHQVGEPWWWVTHDSKICLYDDAAKAGLGGNPADIPDLSAPLNAAQKGLLDAAGAMLAQSTADLAAAVKAAAGPAGAETLLLAFLPTVLDPATPEARRANLPVGWAFPAFDVLQLEDYDWVTPGKEALRAQGRATAEARLNYPRERQHYLSGFVLNGANAAVEWPRIDAAASEAVAFGVAETFIWALPQISRDGFVRLPENSGDATMQSFDDVLFPLALGRDASVTPEFSTNVTITASGFERRNSLWSDARLRFDVGPGVRSDAELGELIGFFRARRGQARGFRLRDPSDFSSNGMTGVPTPTDQLIGTGDGASARFELVKRYGDDDEAQRRRITRPRAGTVRVSVNGAETGAFVLEPLGIIALAITPAAGAVVRAGFLFDVPVRFAEDRLDISGAEFAAGEAPSVPLIELRESA